MDASGRAGKGLGGIPLCLKDNINTAILPTGAATGCLRNHMAGEAAPVARALFDAGALLGGTGNMHELAFGITNNNPVDRCRQEPVEPGDDSRRGRAEALPSRSRRG